MVSSARRRSNSTSISLMSLTDRLPTSISSNKKDGEDDDKNSSTRITLSDFQHDIKLQKRLENLIIELGY